MSLKKTVGSQKKSTTSRSRRSTVKRSIQKKSVQSSPSKTKIDSPQGIDRGVFFLVSVFFTFIRYVVVFLCGAIVALLVASIVMISLYLRTVAAESGVQVEKLMQIATNSRYARIQNVEDRMTILLLGTDALANRDEQSKLTDTIMVMSTDLDTGKIVTFNLPRDLWIASQSAKINALYQKSPQVVTAVIGDITGLPIQKVVVIDIATVGKVIDAVGGLTVDVERSFVDTRFPRADVDVRVERNPAKLYETIAFTKGKEHMSGDRALQYIRSRHSSDPVEGSDNARVRRQQQIISAVLLKMKDPLLVRNPEQIGRLLRIYQEDMQSTLTLEEAAIFAWGFVEKKTYPTLTPRQFGIREIEANGELTHPERFPGGAWVYLPVDPTYAQMRKTVQQWLGDDL